MTTSKDRLDRVTSYLRNIGKLAEQGDTETIKREVRLALQVCGEKP